MQSFRIIRTLIKNWKGYGRIIEGLVLYYWPKAIGKTIADRTSPQRLFGGTLWVRTEDASLAHQLTFLVPKILRNYEGLIGKGIVKNVRFEIGQMEKENKENNEDEVFPEYQMDEARLQAAASIEDEELRKKFLRVAQKATNKENFYRNKGWKKCSCGILTKTDGLCFECQRKEEEEKTLLINYFLANHPDMKFDDIKKQISSIDQEQWEKIKTLMRQRTEDFLVLRSREIRKEKKIKEKYVRELAEPANRYIKLGGKAKILPSKVGLDIWSMLQHYMDNNQ